VSQEYPPLTFLMPFIYLISIVVVAVSMWKIFVKAGKPGWAALIPIYNLYMFLVIAGRPGWWLILYIVPIVNIIITFMVAVSLAKMFGRSTMFGIVMLGIFNFIGYPILGFGKSQYIGEGNMNPNQQPQPVQNVPPIQATPPPQSNMQQTPNQQPQMQQSPPPQQLVSNPPPETKQS